MPCNAAFGCIFRWGQQSSSSTFSQGLSYSPILGLSSGHPIQAAARSGQRDHLIARLLSLTGSAKAAFDKSFAWCATLCIGFYLAHHDAGSQELPHWADQAFANKRLPVLWPPKLNDSDGFFAAPAYLPVMENNPETAVLYNAACPICNFEIRHYARYSGDAGLPIRFDDLNMDARAQWGLDADTAARRLYVLHDGKLTSGIAAFLVLWSQMPRYRWLAKSVGLPGIRPIASAAYDHVLAPMIYRWHLRRQATRAHN